MDRKILFLSKFPIDKNIKEGMNLRINAIDEKFIDCEKAYLELNLFKLKKKSVIKINASTYVYKMNIFIHFIHIINLLRKYKIIYCHSIFNFLPFVIFLPFINSKIILDIHGVVVEELKLEKKIFKSYIYSYVEKIALKKIKLAIVVSNSMQNYYKSKYPWYDKSYLVYNIMPKSLDLCSFDKINIPDTINIIYSGNTQKWQNVDLMLEVVKKSIFRNINFVILTGELDKFKLLLKDKEIDIQKIMINSVLPEELNSYYNDASYGFILRDDIVVNRVSNPTKLIEYLSYGIIPIVLSEKIGDFLDYGYEYIYYNEIDTIFSSIKSHKNIEIAKSIVLKNENVDLNYIVFNL